jgi:hypothetical protein
MVTARYTCDAMRPGIANHFILRKPIEHELEFYNGAYRVGRAFSSRIHYHYPPVDQVQDLYCIADLLPVCFHL